MLTRKMNGLSIAILLPLLLGGCAALPQVCLPPAEPMLSAELFFGRSVGARTISEGDFATFLRREVTPRFPDGLTVLDARGQWRSPKSGNIVRESSKVVKIIFKDDTQKRADLDAIVAVYKQNFHQESVLVSLQPSCVAL
jgi:hypothetical protein